MSKGQPCSALILWLVSRGGRTALTFATNYFWELIKGCPKGHDVVSSHAVLLKQRAAQVSGVRSALQLRSTYRHLLACNCQSKNATKSTAKRLCESDQVAWTSQEEQLLTELAK